MARIDLLLLDGAAWRPEAFARALASTAGHPVNVHLVPWLGEYGVSRAAGCHAGTAPYLAFLNADDELIPGGLAALLEVLESDPTLCGAYGGEEQVAVDGSVTVRLDRTWDPLAQLTATNAQHNGCLMRRAAVMPYLAEMATAGIYCNRLLRGLMVQSGPWRAVEVPVYRWFVRPDALHRTGTDKVRLAWITRRISQGLLEVAAG